MASETILQPPALKIDAALYPKGQKIPTNCRVERRVIWNLLHHLVAAGFSPTFVQGDENVRTPTPLEVMEEVFNLDEARVYFKKGPREYSVFIVLGNDGCDAVSDYTYAKNDVDGWNAAMDAFDGELFV